MHDDGVRVAAFVDLDVGTLYALLRLRVDVFVVEQRVAYQELDGRDPEPGTRHLWIPAADAGGGPAAYLRMLAEPGGTVRIGRVVVARHARGMGHAARLMWAALAVAGERTCTLEAQAHLGGFYRRFGFAEAGPQYVEDGIPHLPMRRPHS